MFGPQTDQVNLVSGAGLYIVLLWSLYALAFGFVAIVLRVIYVLSGEAQHVMVVGKRLMKAESGRETG